MYFAEVFSKRQSKGLPFFCCSVLRTCFIVGVMACLTPFTFKKNCFGRQGSGGEVKNSSDDPTNRLLMIRFFVVLSGVEAQKYVVSLFDSAQGDIIFLNPVSQTPVWETKSSPILKVRRYSFHETRVSRLFCFCWIIVICKYRFLVFVAREKQSPLKRGSKSLGMHPERIVQVISNWEK